MAALLDDIRAKLIAASVGTTSNIFIGEMPDTPDACICLYEYAGSPPDLTHDSQEIEHPGLQVKVRNASYSTGRAKIESVVTALHLTANTTLTATKYLFIRANQSPFCLGRDASRRWEWVVNFTVSKERK